MDYTLTSFVAHGRFGRIFLGMSRDEAVEVMGIPQNWTRKPPSIGPAVNSPWEAPSWYYYGDVVGIFFGDRDTVTDIHITPSRISEKNSSLFSDWGFDARKSIGQFRATLVKNQLEFIEGSSTELIYWILAADDCLVRSFPFDKGKLMPRELRRIDSITKYADKSDAMEMVQAYQRAGK